MSDGLAVVRLLYSAIVPTCLTRLHVGLVGLPMLQSRSCCVCQATTMMCVGWFGREIFTSVGLAYTLELVIRIGATCTLCED